MKDLYTSEIFDLVKMSNTLSLHVKAGMRTTHITSIVEGVVFLDVGAPPEDNKANIAIIKFFTRMLKKPVILARGLHSKEKTLKLL